MTVPDVRLWPPVWNPTVDVARVDEVADRIRRAHVTVVADRPLAPLTTFGIGGPARVFVEVDDDDALIAVLTALSGTKPSEVPLLVIGRGSNLLVADNGFAGIALRLGRGFAGMHREGDRVTVGAAVTMPQLAAWSAKQGLAGLEFAAAIPASVGGSVRMNAGAHGGDVAERLESADLRLPGTGEIVTRDVAGLGLSYRHSDLPDRSVVVSATWRLSPDDPAAIRKRLDEHRQYRRETQPLRARSCGSTFTNPTGDTAGHIIDAAGLKGLRVGGARVSEKHANFIVVDSGAKAVDVLGVIAAVRAAVRAAGGPELVPEVRAVGDFGLATGGRKR